MTIGIVEFLDGPNNYGFFSMKVGGVKYGLGKKAPSFSKGDQVEFDSYLKDGKYNTIKGDVRKVDTASGQVQQAANQAANSAQPANAPYIAPKAPYGAAKDTYWADKEKHDKEVVQPRITYLAAYERAVQFVDLALRNGAISLEKVKGPDKLGVIEAAVAERTQQIVDAASATSGGASGNKKTIEDGAAAVNTGGDDESWS